MIVELHLLQNVSPSCLNRDDTNTPKDAEFGGHRRARISSQCLKRAARKYFDQGHLLPKSNLSERTKRLADHLADLLAADGKERAVAHRAATAALTALMPKTAEKDSVVKTPYLVFLGRNEIAAIKSELLKHWDVLTTLPSTPPENAGGDAPAEPAPGKKPGRRAKPDKPAPTGVPDDVKKALAKLLDGGRAADLALFGRMLADLPDRNIDAACQVAHAISTNRVAMEMDYYTAVDDFKPDDNEGADMIGTVEFNSSCFYRYASIDTAQLAKNLGGDADLARRTVSAFLRASVEAVPSGKQNTFAAHNPPSLVFAVTRAGGQWNLANAFVRPVGGDGPGLVANSVRALDGYWGRLVKMYGPPAGLGAAAATTEDGVLDNLAGFRRDGVADVVKAVDDVLAKGDR